MCRLIDPDLNVIKGVELSVVQHNIQCFVEWSINIDDEVNVLIEFQVSGT